mgnify:CR=1 FL=1
MIRLYLEALFMAVIAISIILSSIHSFNTSEQMREDEVSINRYGED